MQMAARHCNDTAYPLMHGIVHHKILYNLLELHTQTYQSHVRELRVVKKLDDSSRTCRSGKQDQISCIESLLNTTVGHSGDLGWRTDAFTV